MHVKVCGSASSASAMVAMDRTLEVLLFLSLILYFFVARPMHDVVFVAVGQGGEHVRRDALQLIEIHRRLPSALQLM